MATDVAFRINRALLIIMNAANILYFLSLYVPALELEQKFTSRQWFQLGFIIILVIGLFGAYNSRRYLLKFFAVFTIGSVAYFPIQGDTLSIIYRYVLGLLSLIQAECINKGVHKRVDYFTICYGVFL